MSPSTPNRLSSNEVSGLEVDHRHIDRTVEVRSPLPDTLLIAVNEQLCRNPNPGRQSLPRAFRAGSALAIRLAGPQAGCQALRPTPGTGLARAVTAKQPTSVSRFAGPDLPGLSSAQAGGIGAVRSWRRWLVAGASARREVT